MGEPHSKAVSTPWWEETDGRKKKLREKNEESFARKKRKADAVS